MADVANTNSALYSKYLAGGHVMRRSDSKVWGGISNDQIIEQTLMRSLESCGGLTHGRDFNQIQRNMFVFSKPICAEVNESIEKLSKTNLTTSDQHSKETGTSRMKRDGDDYQKIETFFNDHNPFSQHCSSLRNIVTGIVAQPSVNIDRAKEVGEKILADMEGKTVAEYTFKKKSQAVNMAQSFKMASSDGEIDVDPNLLFQRLTAILLSCRKNDV